MEWKEENDGLPFYKRGSLRITCIHKGHPSITYDVKSKTFKYTLLFERWQVFGSEGVEHNLPAKRDPTDSGRRFEQDMTAMEQNT